MQKLQKNLAAVAFAVLLAMLALSGEEPREPTPQEAAVIRFVSDAYAGRADAMAASLAGSGAERAEAASLAKVFRAVADARGGLRSVSAEEVRTAGAAAEPGRARIRWKAEFGSGDEASGEAEAVLRDGRWLVELEGGAAPARP